MNILFVCKYNRFRSRFAEAYFKKINKNKSIKTRGAGIFGGWYPLDPIQLKISKEYKINIEGIPQSLTYQNVKWADLILIVADDVPKKIFRETFMGKKKIIKWKIKDVDETKASEVTTKKIIKSILKKVNKFVKEEEWKN